MPMLLLRQKNREPLLGANPCVAKLFTHRNDVRDTFNSCLVVMTPGAMKSFVPPTSYTSCSASIRPSVSSFCASLALIPV